MRLDATQYPMVSIHYTTEANQPVDINSFLEQFSALLARNQAFVFIASDWPDEQAETEESAALRRAVILWVKANKAALQTLVKGQVHIATNATQAEKVREFAPTFTKVWGYPLLVADSVDAAHAKAKELLA